MIADKVEEVTNKIQKDVKTKNQKSVSKAKKEILLSLLIFLLTFIVRSYKIESGKFVIWDEAHFGKFSSKYLKREFYFDVHPPLGKMMTALSGYLFNQDPEFPFESSGKYPERFDYCGMRRFHAFISSFLPIFAVYILKELGYSMKWRYFGSLLFVFENGNVSISRLILLDSHLLFFTGLVTYFLVRMFARLNFRKENALNETKNLFLLGVSIGCVMSVKWIGCLTTLMAGLLIIFELWKILISKEKLLFLFKKFTKRVVFLVLLPVLIYISWFLIHFYILENSSSDEAHMSSLFQSRLKGSSISRIKKYVSYGSVVSLKSSKMTGGNFHSHDHLYPDKNGYQITSYHHKDENNDWAFQKVTDGEEKLGLLGEGDKVVLYHVATKRYLEVNGLDGYITKEKRVLGSKGSLTTNNVFKIEIVSDSLKKERNIKTLTTKFRIYNVEHKCYLRSTIESYPDWGFSQGEITCSNIKDETTLWNIEKNDYIEGKDNSDDIKNIEYKEVKNIKSAFITHILEHNKAMYLTNKSFTQDEDLEPQRIVSKPYEWFLLKRGLRMTSWKNDDLKFYMFGNPFIWYLSGISVILSPIILLIKIISLKRKDKKVSSLKKDFLEVFIYFGGWFLHYVPFFFIQRVLYFHHYFPALFFAILSINYVFKHLKRSLFYLIIFMAVVFFFAFSPLTYGFLDPEKDIARRQWIMTWDFQ